MADTDLPPDLVREHLGRILDSASLRSAESLRRLLRYTVETTLAGKGEGLKEYTIGVEALGRPGSFDPRQDNIVRVQARKLRERLAAYYGGEGRKESCRIVYHPGSYLPFFAAAQEPAAPPRTVAVLPLMNLTADSGAGYFCDGLAEELIDLLARSDGLRVVARTSSFQFKGAQMDAREIGQRLGADLLIEGAVRSAGDRYRITVRLLSSNDGCEIWAEKYDCTLHDVLELETQIATSVASALSSGTPPPGSATDSEAITLYLRARYAWNQRTEAGFRKALELYTAATRRDSRAAKAWAGIAECHVLMNDARPGAAARLHAPSAGGGFDGAGDRRGPGAARSALAAVTCLYDRDYEAAAEQWRRALAAGSGVRHGAPLVWRVSACPRFRGSRRPWSRSAKPSAWTRSRLPSRTTWDSSCTGAGASTRRSNSAGRRSRCIPDSAAQTFCWGGCWRRRAGMPNRWSPV